MKLVQLLAKELKEWPEGATFIVQDENKNVWHLDKAHDLSYQDSEWKSKEWFDLVLVDGSDILINSLASDNKTSKVTQEQWQAEREKMNKPKWIRHRGGNQPVEDSVKVEYRMRDGVISNRLERAADLRWAHLSRESDIMAYRIIEETKDQEIEEVRKFSKDVDMNIGQGEIIHGPVSIGDTVITAAHPKFDTNLGTLTYKLEIDAIEATQQIDSLVAKWGQIVSPLKWRDAIIHCQAIIEDCEREIERNVSLLDAECLMMQKDSKKAMQHYQTAIDMSDWRNWQAGDIFEVVKKTDYFTVGNRYSVKYTANTDAPITATDDDGDEFCLLMEEIKFIRRP